MEFSLEIKREVWNDKRGSRVEIGPDRDSLGLIEIREYDGNSKIINRSTFHPDSASLIAKSILACCEEMKGQENA